MSLWSMSVSFRLGLGFHALNNEGSDGSNLMQPRRIDVGELTYDGISGEIVRRHILEIFVNLCQQDTVNLPVMPMSAGLHPDRGPLGIRAAARSLNSPVLNSANLYQSVRRAVSDCAVLDVGGFLAAFGKDAPNDAAFIAESHYITTHCSSVDTSKEQGVNPVKRETCFDVGWLISEEPQDLTVTQHSAYRNTAKENNRYAQTMRSNIYGGVIRADLHRIGTDDNWYLLDQDRLAIQAPQQQARQAALIHAITGFIASPTGSKTAAWTPHVFLTEGVILLTSARTAPFVSPIKVDLRDESRSRPVSANANYRSATANLANKVDTWIWEFQDIQGLLSAANDAIARLKGQKNGAETQ